MTSVQDDKATVAALDTAYQAAVESDDVETMDRILADDFVLVTGSGKVFNNTDLLEEARGDRMVYEVQCDGVPFEYQLWFSDTYLRTPSGWKYVFAQASLPLPASSDLLSRPERRCNTPARARKATVVLPLSRLGGYRTVTFRLAIWVDS